MLHPFINTIFFSSLKLQKALKLFHVCTEMVLLIHCAVALMLVCIVEFSIWLLISNVMFYTPCH